MRASVGIGDECPPRKRRSYRRRTKKGETHEISKASVDFWLGYCSRAFLSRRAKIRERHTHTHTHTHIHTHTPIAYVTRACISVCASRKNGIACTESPAKSERAARGQGHAGLRNSYLRISLAARGSERNYIDQRKSFSRDIVCARARERRDSHREIASRACEY